MTAVRRAAPAAAVGIGLFLAACLAPRIGLYTGDAPADVKLFQTFGERMLGGEIPYRDFFVEYPPGALPAFVLPALGPVRGLRPALQAAPDRLRSRRGRFRRR